MSVHRSQAIRRVLARNRRQRGYARKNTTAAAGKTALAIGTFGATALVEAGKQKDRKWTEAEENAKLWQARYEECKMKNEKKGKPVYPHNPGKGPFYSDCRDKYKEWKKQQAKAADRAVIYKDQLVDKGLLNEWAAEEINKTIYAASDEALAAYESALAEEKKAKSKGQKGKEVTASKAEVMAASLDPDSVDTGFPLWLLGVGGFIAIGGIAFMVMSAPSDEEDEAVEKP